MQHSSDRKVSAVGVLLAPPVVVASRALSGIDCEPVNPIICPGFLAPPSVDVPSLHPLARVTSSGSIHKSVCNEWSHKKM